MTHKDFVLIAGALARAMPADNDPAAFRVWDCTVCAVADALRGTNERFDRSRFIAAANGTPTTGRDRPR